MKRESGAVASRDDSERSCSETDSTAAFVLYGAVLFAWRCGDQAVRARGETIAPKIEVISVASCWLTEVEGLLLAATDYRWTLVELPRKGVGPRGSHRARGGRRGGCHAAAHPRRRPLPLVIPRIRADANERRETERTKAWPDGVCAPGFLGCYCVSIGLTDNVTNCICCINIHTPIYIFYSTKMYIFPSKNLYIYLFLLLKRNHKVIVTKNEYIILLYIIYDLL